MKDGKAMIICLTDGTNEKLRCFTTNNAKTKLYVVFYPYSVCSLKNKIRHEHHLPDEAIYFFEFDDIYQNFKKYFKIEKKIYRKKTYYYFYGEKALFRFFSENSCVKLLKNRYSPVFLNLKPWIHIPESVKEKNVHVVICKNEKMETVVKQMEMKECDLRERVK